jgi:hypothetical protein
MTGLANMTKTDHAASDAEKQEIVAATGRHKNRPPRVAINIQQPENVNAALAVIDGLKPKNEIEAMLALQMAATHALAMKFSARLYSGGIETIPQQDSAALTLSRLQRAFTTQMDSLSNMRRGGRQKVVVEHVHVYPGGQAIVGNVTHSGRGGIR